MKQTNLSKRVEKAKKLRIIPSGEKGCYNIYGSKGDHYKICLKSETKNMVTPDGYRPTKVFRTNCQKSTVNINDPYTETCEHCKGNTQHTVCYHCLGAIWFSLSSIGFQVSFFETYHTAINGLNFGGTLAKIENNNETGAAWCIYRKVEKKEEETQLFDFQKEIIKQSLEKGSVGLVGLVDLMRGSENDEGID